jgi:type II secretory pathway component PulF
VPALSQQLFFFRQLHALVSAAVPLVQAFETLEQNTTSTSLKKLARAMGENANAGIPISDAFAKFPGMFTPRVINTVRAGEAGGYLPTALRQVIDCLSGSGPRTGFVMSDMYLRRLLVWLVPIILIWIGIGFFTRWVMAQAGHHYGSTPLYLVRRRNRQIAFLVVLVIAAIVASNPRLRQAWSKIAAGMSLGPVGALSREAHFARSLSQLLRSGMEISVAFEHAISATGDVAMLTALTPQIAAIRNGKPLDEVMRESGFFSKHMIDFAHTGQLSGTLPDSLDQAAYHSEQDAATYQPRSRLWRPFF